MSDENDPTESGPAPEPPAEAQEDGSAAAKSQRAQAALRLSLACIALAVVLFAYFLPDWVDRGMTQVNRDLLQSIAEDTAHKIVANDWSEKQGMDYAAKQAKLGAVDTDIAIAIDATSVDVRIRATADSANPFASQNGVAQENHIEVSYSLTR